MKSLIDKLEILESPDRSYVPRSTDAVMAQAGIALQIDFGEDYAIWCKTLGAGELAGFFRIAVPLGTEHEFDLVTYNRIFVDDRDLWVERLGEPFLDSFVCFSETIGGEFYGWNRSEPTGSGEYQIYCLPRHSDPTPEASRSFEWVEKVCFATNSAGDTLEYNFRRFDA